MAGIAGQVGCVTLFIVLVSLIGGLWLDRQFETKPVFTIILLLGSAPFALFLTFWMAMRAVKNIKPLPPAEPKQKEEKTGE
ncbi:MAG: AtpZ/AtpI family protein [Chloroflexi bacterium]|nr:AtpZ/AtpI family protein [Chloroflexota bacterium]